MPIEFCRLADLKLADDPINPEWILAGTPTARCAWWSSGTDGVADNYVWECTAGTFRWFFPCDETVHVISGAVEVEGDGVAATYLAAGDAALFRAGTWATWTVKDHVRKHAVIAPRLPGSLRVQLRYGRRAKLVVRRLLGREAAGASLTSIGNV